MPNYKTIYEQLILCETAALPKPPVSTPQPHYFRPVAGVVVVGRGGRLANHGSWRANMAARYGRARLSARPALSRSNHLIRTGAALIETVDDIMEAVRPLIENMALKTPDQKTPKRRPARLHRSATPCGAKLPSFWGRCHRIDDLVEQAEAPLQSVHLVLLELELAGRLTYDSGGQVCLDINN